MESNNPGLTIEINTENEFLLLLAKGVYSLAAAKNLFKEAIDNALQHGKNKILVDVNNITGTIPVMDRFYFSEYLAGYMMEHAAGSILKFAVVGKEPIIDAKRFGETVAVNRGVNAKVYTSLHEAISWLT